MNKLYLVTLLIFIAVKSFGQTGFQNSYGDTTVDFGSAIIKSSQGFYCIVGATQLQSADSTEIAIYFVNSMGDLISATTVGLPGNDYPTSIVEAVDGNFIITGYTYASPLDTVHSDIFAIKVDNVFGYELWSHFYGGPNDDMANCIIATPDGNYLIAGSTRSYGPFDRSALAMKIDDNGELIWSKITGIGVETEYYNAGISLDTNYILCGTAVDGNGSDHYITKMLSNGTILWTNQVGSTGNESSAGLALTSDSGIVISGKYVDPSVVGDDFLITKLDNAGNFLWAKSYATVRDEQLYSVLENSQGNLVAAGNSNTDTTGVTINHVALLETDNTGSVIWSNVYGYILEVCEGYQIISSIDEGYACVGTTYATGDPLGEAFLLKTDTSGVSGCDELPYSFTESSLTMNIINAGFEDPVVLDTITYFVNTNAFTDQYVQMCFWDNVNKIQDSENIILYPNPASESVTIEGEFDGGTLSVYNQFGQILMTAKISGNKSLIQTSDFPSGLYFIRISTAKSNSTLKFIRQ